MKINNLKQKIAHRFFASKNTDCNDVGVGMKFSVIVFMSFRNIIANKFRSFLTIGGVSIGIGIITFLISLGFGVQEMVIGDITKNNPINTIDVDGSNLENFIILNDEVLEKIKNIEGVSRIERRQDLGGKFYNGDAKVDAVMFGITKAYMDMANIKISEGRMDFLDKEPVIMITPKLANLLGFANPAEAVGKEIEYEPIISKEIITKSEEEKILGRDKIRIAAIINDDANKNNSISAYAMFEYLHDNFDVHSGQSGKVEIKNEIDLESVRSKIEQMGLSTESVKDIIMDINAFFNVVRIVMIVFGTIIMSISAMGMLNTLSVSLLQRTREVGILKALGAKRRDIFKMFILEAAIISFTGGMMGLFLGFGFAKLFNGFFNIMAVQKGSQVASFISMPYYFVLALVFFIAFLGFATGIFPARRASKIHALDALHSE